MDGFISENLSMVQQGSLRIKMAIAQQWCLNIEKQLALVEATACLLVPRCWRLCLINDFAGLLALIDCGMVMFGLRSSRRWGRNTEFEHDMPNYF
jgi:hypothetical protein